MGRSHTALLFFRLLIALLAYDYAAPAAAAESSRKAAPVPVYTYKVVRAYPHDVGAFTEGLFYKDGVLYESTGLKGKSSIRKVQLETGKVLQRTDLPADIFGEGIVAWNDRLIGLTWQSQLGFVLNLQSFALIDQFTYPGEGWGLTHNDREIIMSDGTAELRFLDPRSLTELRRLKVMSNGAPLTQLNELEWVEGQIFANVWQTDRVARIDPTSGQVVGWIDLNGLLPKDQRVAGYTDVLNGIAYDASRKRLFVTGKMWPKLFEIQLVNKTAPAAASP
jgi:glutaminyl-peptide cyclotransferase